ncbi:hypothetical protein PPERSA_06246 [Pseudocohnilembus persalinus]|uniref:Transmembrane protein n=1 Tax=Pseudocohnilembus persalinus TaxID=266149 RepID=A0A0V0QV38_PSEPJ|nr:hypothetical protein PPERSA_06246 [Pseudocohnilembus persalinus]|eukprot:KRX06275.1 hypothetical protein PPERSA_06246 [Pseudocohnilembus persalinus]
MALRRLLKNSSKIQAVNAQQIRGAHGWPRPDVPLDFAYTYHHKREISIFDLNCWYYDHTQPEYMFTWNEQHLEDQYGAAQEIAKQSTLLIALMAGLGIFYAIFGNSRVSAVSYHFFNDQQHKFTLDLMNDRKGLKQNWLGLSLTGENGTFYQNYDLKDNVKADLEKKQNDVNKVIKINDEGKIFINSMIESTKQQLASKQKQQH